MGFVADLPERVVLDEVQRVPGLFTSLKASVDRRRTPGRFLLTGSSNVLLVPALADSLAGRMEILRLHPLAQCELAGREPRFLDALFDDAFKTMKYERMGVALVERVVAGGYPAALTRRDKRRRAIWYRDYVDALIQRDVRELARIRALHALPRLLAAAAGQTAGDTGVACALLGIDAPALASDRATLGHLLETFVYQELRRQASWSTDEIRFHHFRDKSGAEVDIVIERGARQLAGVEVKASASISAGDFRGLRKLKDVAGTRFAAGIVLYDGEATVTFGAGLHAVPVRCLWETT